MNPTDVTKITEQAAQGGPDTLLVTIILLMVALSIGGWFWFGFKPKQLADIERQKKETEAHCLLAEAVARLKDVTLSTNEHVTETRDHVELSIDGVAKIKRAICIACSIAEKLDTENKIDAELGEIKGLLQ